MTLSPYRFFAAALFLMGLAFLAFGGSFADASDYCVNMPAATACAATFNANLPGALSQAASNPGPDRVLIGPVTRSNMAGYFYAASTPGNTVEIVGSGPSTVLTGVDTTGDGIVLTLGGAPGSKVRDLTLKVPVNADTQPDYGLNIGPGGTAQDISVTAETGAEIVDGIATTDAHLTGININLPHSTSPSIGIFAEGATDISNSTIAADEGVESEGRTLTTTISNSRIDSTVGVFSDGGVTDMTNSLISLKPGGSATGIQLQNLNNGIYPIDAHLDGVSIVNDGAVPAGTGILAQADSGTESAHLTMANTVITGTGQSLKMVANGGRSVSATSTYSAYDQAGVVQTPGTGIITYLAGTGDVNLTGDPGFLSTTGPDYVPLGTSPLVDAGDPAAPTPGTTDLLGKPRACHGTDSGIIRRDIGAFERQTVLADDCTYPDTTIVSGPGATTTDPTPPFSYSSSKASSSWKCSFDGKAAVACGPISDAPDLGLGAHTVSVAASDAYGNVDQLPATRTYTVVRPPDRTAPRITVVGKVPKKTSKKVLKIRFKSNEAGSTFTCRVNSAKAKKCKSPLKAKLKKGKKNVIRIVATDKAGNHSKAKVLKVKQLKR